MSQREYLKVLNEEISKLNHIIDMKIMHAADYRKEARRHKILLAQLRRNEVKKSFSRLMTSFLPLWR